MGLATLLVGWFLVRMFCGASYDVWRVSLFLGACAPLNAAAAFLYIQRVGDREDSVLAAWLVRSISIHFMLAWLLGVADWMRGPPGLAPTPNADMIAPVALVAFFPVFGLGFVTFRWLLSATRRLTDATSSATRTVDFAEHHIPYRGAARRQVSQTVRAFPWAMLASSALGVMAVCFAHLAPWSSVSVLAVCAIALGATSRLGPETVAPSVLSLVGVAGTLLARHHGAPTTSFPLACAWPWMALAAIALYLTALEASLKITARPRAAMRAIPVPR